MQYRNTYKTRDGRINCEVLHPNLGWVPFQATKFDSTPHGKDLYNRLLNDPDVHEETDEEFDERVSLMARAIRNSKLIDEVDPILSNTIRFSELSVEKQDEWKAYRKALLDISLQEGFPHEIVWPTKPE